MMNEEVLQKAIDTYGRIPQMDMCVEEMAELIKAINKYKRAYFDVAETAMPTDIYDNVCEEIADVKIMIKQMEMMFGESNVEEEVDCKMNRLAERLGMNNEKVTTCDKKEYWG